MAFSKAARVRISPGFRSRSTSSTIFRPAASATCTRRESTAGIAAAPGSVRPSASVTHAIVDAVPIVMQCPFERDIEFSISSNSTSVIRPARSSSW
jgi:hypothetical protein